MKNLFPLVDRRMQCMLLLLVATIFGGLPMRAQNNNPLL
jgi:hypothetical protein